MYSCGRKILSFETDDEIVEFSSEHSFNDVKFAYAYSKKKLLVHVTSKINSSSRI